MECDRHALGSLHQLLYEGNVHFSVSREATEHHPVGTGTAGVADVFQHDFLLNGGIQEIPSTGTDDDMQADGEQLAGNCDFAEGRRGASFGYPGAKLHAAGSAFLRFDGAFHGIGAHFKLKTFCHHSAKVSSTT